MGEAAATEQCDHYSGCQCQPGAAELLHAELLVDLCTDNREFGECRVDQFLVQLRILPQRHTQHGGQGEQQREGRAKGVIGQLPHQVACFVVTELLDHGYGERDDGMALLPAVDATYRPLQAIHQSALAPSSSVVAVEYP